jgi:hypothetical protein
MDTSKDRQYLTAGIPELENYLLSKEIYYPIGNHLPQLTLGGILLSLVRLGGEGKKFEAQIEAIRSKWRTAWDAKAGREVRARSELWMNYLLDYKENPEVESSFYSQNVRYRAMLTLLGRPEHESDEFVKSVFKAGKFVWDEECADSFPRDTFWFLYGTLKE